MKLGVKGELAGPTGEPYESYVRHSVGLVCCDADARINESDTALQFGDVACGGAAATPGQMGACKPMEPGARVLGLTVRQDLPVPDASGNYGWNYPRYSTVTILKRGYIWAEAAENVTAEDACIGVVASPGAVGGTTGGAADGVTRLAFPATYLWRHTVRIGNVGLIRALAT